MLVTTILLKDAALLWGLRFIGTVTATRAGESLLEINAPLVTRIYRQNYGIVDRSNQEGTYYKLDMKTRRKQNRHVLFDAIETYGLINTHTIFINSLEIVADLKKSELTTTGFRFFLVRNWLARCRMSTGSTTLHYPFVAKKHPPNMLSLIHSPRKGTHKPCKINAVNPKKQLRCRICSQHTSFKCEKCGSEENPVPLCRGKTGRNCWEAFHTNRVFDQLSSQSTDAASIRSSQTDS